MYVCVCVCLGWDGMGWERLIYSRHSWMNVVTIHEHSKGRSRVPPSILTRSLLLMALIVQHCQLDNPKHAALLDKTKYGIESSGSCLTTTVGLLCQFLVPSVQLQMQECVLSCLGRISASEPSVVIQGLLREHFERILTQHSESSLKTLAIHALQQAVNHILAWTQSSSEAIPEDHGQVETIIVTNPSDLTGTNTAISQYYIPYLLTHSLSNDHSLQFAAITLLSTFLTSGLVHPLLVRLIN